MKLRRFPEALEAFDRLVRRRLGGKDRLVPDGKILHTQTRRNLIVENSVDDGRPDGRFLALFQGPLPWAFAR